MRVFVAGGTGYVGGAIASRLVREGHSVTGWPVPTRPASGSLG
ncbi:NAD-dependent epimerase/dehydratase family protein [Streptomyces xiangluensis]|uniref:NAD-dependent epimerase/dehydratase family protein n=1 Tax=Streptomyces xiangluensis TaxID=2665720 RepID=A0ABV8Z5V2_9ACTN